MSLTYYKSTRQVSIANAARAIGEYSTLSKLKHLAEKARVRWLRMLVDQVRSSIEGRKRWGFYRDDSNNSPKARGRLARRGKHSVLGRHNTSHDEEHE